MLGVTGFPLFLIAVLLLNITPGPDTAYIVARSVSQGRRAGIVSVLGISTGCMCIPWPSPSA
jgi:threonine/homoserine/homoserine lactone efflux protein